MSRLLTSIFIARETGDDKKARAMILDTIAYARGLTHKQMFDNHYYDNWHIRNMIYEMGVEMSNAGLTPVQKVDGTTLLERLKENASNKVR